MASQQPPTQPTSANVEMNNLATGVPSSLDPDQDTTAGASQMDGGAEFTAVKTNTNTSEPVATAETSHQEDPTTTTTSPLAQTPTATSTSHAQAAPVLTRKETEALGPATEAPIAPPPSTAGPALSITLMLTTGARHPYKIDEKYLRNRKVEARNTEGDFDPRGLSGYQLKELVWTDWRTEWEPRPASPSSIRLIILGRMIEDKALLKDLPFKTDDTNVVHMTVKPADFVDDEEVPGKGTGKGHSIRGRDDGEQGAGCRCVIL